MDGRPVRFGEEPSAHPRIRPPPRPPLLRAPGPRPIRRDQVRLRHRRRVELARQGAHRLLARPAAQVPGPAGDHVQARPVHQRRPRHDEPLRARRGLRHRGRRRDRPRPRALRALHRREPAPRAPTPPPADLLVGDRQGAPRRLPRARPCRSSRTSPTRSRSGSAPRRPTTSTSSSSRSAARSATSRSSRSSRPSASSAATSGRTTSATCTSPWCPTSRPRASRRPSPPSTRSPSCAAGASSPTSSSAAPTSRSPTA